jgi:hypothetical protein
MAKKSCNNPNPGFDILRERKFFRLNIKHHKRHMKAFFLGLTLAAFSFTSSLQAEEICLKGTLTCSKCDLSKDTDCTNVIVVKKGDAEEIYYLEGPGTDGFHPKICKEGKPGMACGEVSEKDGKKILTIAKAPELD